MKNPLLQSCLKPLPALSFLCLQTQFPRNNFGENMFFLVFTFFSLFGSSSSHSLVSDFHVLLALKQEFEFSDSNALSTWTASNFSSVCSWDRIKCSDKRVVSVDLTDLSLGGSVSQLISSLDQLSELSVAGNYFSGAIEVVNLSYLRFLNISNNQFIGTLNWNFSNLPNLEVLDAFNNNFTALLPTEILNLRNLKYLDLGGNFFHGNIPVTYGSFEALQYLSLAGNDLVGKIPGELGNLTNLREIYLSHYNVFEGGIPSELGRLENLVIMEITDCGLDGQIPHELGNLKALNTLYLHTNLLSGSVPKQLGNLTNLVFLDLSNNALTGEIPSEFADLKYLKLFNLFINKLHGSIPNYVVDFPYLESMALWMNNFTGTIPKNLGQNGRLQLLDLSTNKLTGRIPQDLCSSNQLKILILMNNFLFGPIPDGFGTCTSLTKVRLGHNYLNGSIPNGFIYLPQLNLAEFQDNYLSDTLSENWESSSKPIKLGQLNLSNNLLSGTLPFSLSNFSSLQILLLNGNQFSGTIPPSIGELTELLKLDLSRNSLSSLIPPEIGNCIHLTYLDLSKNNLSGPIPPEISNAHILNYLNLSRNHLNESLPRSIEAMKSLTIADFSFNDFSGKLPESGQLAFFNASSFAGNPQLCGSLLNNPCNLATTTSKPRKTPAYFELIFALGLVILFLGFVIAAVVKVRSYKRKAPSSWKMTSFQNLDFTVYDVLECVKDGNVIGRGGAGIVYHGKMPNGVEIAVKKLLGFGPNSHDHGFRAEIQTLGNIRHRNIVRLLAFCSNKETNLLVYEYMRNGSLGEALHGKKAPLLGWNLRYKIAIEAAKGLCYLHHDCSPLIVHRDVKSNNILLNSNFEAHVADFGLAKFMFDGGASECMSVIAGSYGYIAPEYAYTLKVDEKSDVYSFGVVLLELLTGLRPVGDFGDGVVDITQWCKRTLANSENKSDIIYIVDKKIEMVSKEEAKHLFFVAMLCVEENSVERPTMREVVQMLAEISHQSFNCFQSSSTSSPCQNLKYDKKEKKDLSKFKPKPLV